ncbi:MAG TPA: NAD(P)-dependent oxidoreductase [Bryobacteraceae bacterium]|jgi:3-hydroxyisobutyrate dehydrogenase-like beta-hydroxyacid dehydrogenase|nr:NAD(P)-dependent oxidoreductase [Bryobacteraceae bacterium]
MKIGFIGLGQMGSGMARNLLRAGHQLAVYNRTREKAQALSKDGARLANSPADAARGADAVFTMLSDDRALSEVVFGDNGLASVPHPAPVHISSSSISVALARRLAQEHAHRGQRFLTACVFGRPDAAENKKLIVVAAGELQTLDPCRPLFDALGRATFVAGPEPWHANLFKLCGNFMIASMLETFSEAFAATRKAGLDHHRFLEIMNELFQSPVYQNYGATIADEKFSPAGFALNLGLKDVRQVLEAAHDLAVPMPFASVVRDHFVSAIAHGQESLDWSSLARVLARDAGLEEPGESKSARA